MNWPTGGSGTNATIGGIGLGATAGGGLLSAFGALGSGFANQRMFDYQASVARLNQQIAEQNARFAMQAGGVQGMEYGLRAGQQAGQMRAALGASNLDVRSGSAAQVIVSQQRVTQLDLDQIRSNAAKTAYGYRVGAAEAGAQASVYNAAAAQAPIAGAISAGSSILGGAASVSSEWLQGQRVGLWSAAGGGGGGGDQLFGGGVDVFGGSQ